jgi:hypothetical protein
MPMRRTQDTGTLRLTTRVFCLVVATVVIPCRADDFFEARIRPLLVERCFECHAGDVAEGGLRLDSRRGFDAGGESGPVVDRAAPDRSLLLQLVRHAVPGREMPQGGERLSAGAVADLARWIALGLPGLPDEPPAPAVAAEASWSAKLAARRDHWAWQPVRPVRPPDVDHARWSRTAIDRFLLAALRESGLEPAPPAEPVTLLRRLTLALTGLPPTVADADEFLADTSADAVERLVDRLLASPAFGEHWAGYWLDLVRFGETGGYVRDYPIPEAWRYRDYVIRAFQADVPYDRLVAEHIAGDLLPPRHNPVLRINEAVLGTGHLRLMEISSTATDVALEEAQMLESQIDTLGKAFQGLTISCARCHDHKFDAISQRDYYALFGTLASARQTQAVIDDDEVRRAGMSELADLKERIVTALAVLWRDDLAAVGQALAAERMPSGVASGALGRALDDAVKAIDHPLHAVAVARRAGLAGEASAEAFARAARAVRDLATTRSARNAAACRVAADFATSPGSWHVGGVLPDTLHRAASDVTLLPAGDEIVARVIGPGFATDRLSQKHGGSVRSDDFPLAARFVSLRVAGGDAAQIRLIQHNFQQMENVAQAAKVRHVDSRLPTWVTLPVGHQPSWQGGRSYLEVVTKDDVAHFRRSDAGDGPFKRTVSDRSGRSWFAMDRVVFHDEPEPPADELEASLLVLDAVGTPADPEGIARGVVAAGTAAIDAFANGTATVAQARVLNVLLTAGLLRNRQADVDELTRLRVNRSRQLDEEIPRFRRAPAMAAEGAGFDAALQKRGQPSQPGDVVPRRYLEILAGVRQGGEATIDPRLALARSIAAPDNPLTARVMVNRVWSWLFGRGIVATVDNVGATGATPSHPELLDFLASRFVEQGWSLKALIREIVLTEAYRASSVPPPQAVAVDPENRLLSHMPIQRLRAETLRDCLLAVSGELDRAAEGFTGPADQSTRVGPANTRRGIYQYLKREAQDHMMLMFDAPEGTRTTGLRESTSVPGQALLLLNNEFVHRQAAAWAGRSLATQRGLSLDRRVEELFRQALVRPPSSAERDALVVFFEAQADAYGLDAAGRAADTRPWADLCHVLLTTKEFLHVR